MAILVRLPYASRPFALPILVALYRDKKTNRAEGRRHKTPAELMCGLLAVLMHWFPERKFHFAGDNAYGTHAMAKFAACWSTRLTLVSKIVPDANLFAPPPRPVAGKNGRPPIKGRSLPSPSEVARSRKRPNKLRVRWYGGRWNIETTFQEMREHFGLETTRGWSRQTVLRMAPCLLVLYTIVVLFYDTLGNSSESMRRRSWLGKETTTMSDMITSVRHYLWFHWVFAQVPEGGAVQKLPGRIRKLLDFGLTQAA